MEGLAKLHEDHAELAKLVRSLGEMIGRPTPPPQIELFDVRRQLTALLIAHLKVEDWVLYPRLLASGDAQIAKTARAFNDEMGGLAAAYAGHTDKWIAAAIDADWRGYCTETKAILDALMNRLTRENRELLPLLERLDAAA
jgi:hypothetical protein